MQSLVHCYCEQHQSVLPLIDVSTSLVSDGHMHRLLLIIVRKSLWVGSFTPNLQHRFADNATAFAGIATVKWCDVMWCGAVRRPFITGGHRYWPIGVYIIVRRKRRG